MPGVDKATTRVFESAAYVNFQFFLHISSPPSLIAATSAKKSEINRLTGTLRNASLEGIRSRDRGDDRFALRDVLNHVANIRSCIVLRNFCRDLVEIIRYQGRYALHISVGTLRLKNRRR